MAPATNVVGRVQQVFVSYKRNIEPDQTIAGQIVAALTAQGHSVFIDQRLKIGQEWAKEIEAQVTAADYLVVLLTAASSSSEMVRGEIEVARKAAERDPGRPKILPIRVQFSDPLPYPLNAWLDKIQYALWNGPSDNDILIQAISAAMTGDAIESPPPLEPASAPAAERAPAYAAVLPPPGGAIEVDDPFYIERSADASATALAQRPGQTLVIKGPRQMGKSSLLMRVAAAGANAGKQVAFVDFQLTDERARASADTFFQWFAASVVEQLQLSASPSEHWDAASPTTQNCTYFIEQQVLQVVQSPVMIVIDEADVVFKTTFAADFFSMLRNWHGRRANPIRRAWKRLDLVIVTAVDPDQFIDRPSESPFNVGVIQVLEDFSPQQMAELNRRHPRPLGTADLDALFRLVGGHPYLARRALYQTATAALTTTVNQLVASVDDEMGPFGDHLRYYMLRIMRTPQLTSTLKEVLTTGAATNNNVAYRLQAAGLVRRDGAKLVARCDLYKRYFGMRFGLHG